MVVEEVGGGLREDLSMPKFPYLQKGIMKTPISVAYVRF